MKVIWDTTLRNLLVFVAEAVYFFSHNVSGPNPAPPTSCSGGETVLLALTEYGSKRNM